MFKNPKWNTSLAKNRKRRKEYLKSYLTDATTRKTSVNATSINVLTVLNLHMLTHTILSFMTVWKTSRSYALHPCGLYSGYTYSLILILPMTYSYTVRNNFIVTFKTINYSEIWVPCSDSEPEDDPMDDDEEWESYLECMKQQQNILDTLSPPWNPKPRYMYTGYIYLEYVYPAGHKHTREWPPGPGCMFWCSF